MKIEEAIAWIHGRLPFGSRPGLERVEALLDQVDHPELKVPTIHIAGTNGKGSTVTYLRCLLEEAGLKVGTFTSPYVAFFNERIAVNGVGISDARLIHFVEKYQPIVAQLDENPKVAGITEFETLTALAFDYFLDEKVDVALIEVGLGGLMDSTNVVKPLLTGITTIGMDHTDILGDTLEEIAAQKAGIIKQGIPVVTGNIEPDALAVIEAQAQTTGSEIYRLDQEYSVVYQHPERTWGEVFTFQNAEGKLPNLMVPLLGHHQVENAGMAIELFQVYAELTHLPYQTRDIQNGLKKAVWPGRMERLNDEPLVILDGAHNNHAVRRLAENLKKEFGGKKIYILFSALSTKNIDEMLRILQGVPNSEVYLTTFDYPKAIDLAKMTHLEGPNVKIVSLWQFGLADILEKMDADDMLLITGSLYFVSQVRAFLVELGESNE